MRKPQATVSRSFQSGKALAYMLGAVLVLGLALLFAWMRPDNRDREEIQAGAGIPPGLQADLQRTLEKWAATFKARDLTGHVRFYRDPVTWFGKSRTRQEIWLKKKQLLDEHPVIKVFAVSDLKVEKFELGLATLTFTLRFDYGPGGAPPQSGVAFERLTCRSSGNDWKIESEYIEREM